MNKLEAQFEKVCRDSIVQTIREVRGYNPSWFAKMLDKNGAVGTATQLIYSPARLKATGFIKLYEAGRLDLTIEAMVWENPKFYPLFENHGDLVNKAFRDLEFYHYPPALKRREDIRREVGLVTS